MLNKTELLTLYVDGDILLYKSCINAENDVRFSDDIHVLYSNLGDARDCFIKLLDDLGADQFDQVIICLSDDNNWRKSVMPSYKHNRVDLRKPLAFREMKQWVYNEFYTRVLPNLEADDLLGMAATRTDTAAVIWSPDKDLKQVPGMHWDGNEVYRVDEWEGARAHMFQTLVGDQTDGYKGVPGIGVVKATKILEQAVEYAFMSNPLGSAPNPYTVFCPAVIRAYEKAGLTYDDYLQTATVAYILQHPDYNKEDGSIRRPFHWEIPRD